jgi:hypothetical protein
VCEENQNDYYKYIFLRYSNTTLCVCLDTVISTLNSQTAQIAPEINYRKDSLKRLRTKTREISCAGIVALLLVECDFVSHDAERAQSNFIPYYVLLYTF